jgi:23S rRNA-/tRNA-specific pseudouridylate synthase
MARTLSKPAGIPVFPPHDDPHGDCVLARLLAEEPARADVAWPDGYAGGLAHRLDTSTSGALIAADDPAELAKILAMFQAKYLTKTYRLRAAKPVRWDRNTIDRPIAHDSRHKGKMVVQRGESTPHRGRWLPASTAFTRIAGDLWEARMSTGVMHQIRVHAAFLGIPLAGDRRYGGGPPPADAPPGAEFLLHHVGISGPDGFSSAPVPLPAWAAG